MKDRRRSPAPIAGRMAEQAALSFGGLLRQLRAEARLTQLPANGSILAGGGVQSVVGNVLKGKR